MEFNPDKCEVIRITKRRKKKIVTNYSIQEHQLKKVKGAKYLGLTIDRTLSWNDHISNVTKKANNTRAFLQRNINRCSEAIKTLCYQRLSGQSWIMCRRYGIRPQRRTSNLWRTCSDRLPASRRSTTIDAAV